MKDIFSNRRLFMSNTAKEIYEYQDKRVFVDFFGFDKLHTKMLIAQLQVSLIELIQNSLANEADLIAQERAALNRRLREEQEQIRLESTMNSESTQVSDEQVSNKSMALEKEQSQRVGQAQEEARRLRDHRNVVRKMAKAGATPQELKDVQDAFDEASENLMNKAFGIKKI